MVGCLIKNSWMNLIRSRRFVYINFFNLFIISSSSKDGISDTVSHYLLFQTGKSPSFSRQNTLEKKSSVVAVISSPISFVYIRSPMDSLLLEREMRARHEDKKVKNNVIST